LAHNFIGHNAYTEAQLRNRAFTQANGVASSVMEYAPTNLWPRNTPHGDFFQTTIGPYDYHVIHWGYAPVPNAKTPEDEVSTLNHWAAAASDPKYAFASDEDVAYPGHAVDPRIAQFMLTGDSISWCRTQMGIDRGLMHSLDSRFPRPQMPWDQERFAFRLIVGQYGSCAQAMTHYIAGEHLSRSRRGDAGAPPPLTPISRDEEHRAFSNLDTYMFSDSAWQISPSTLRRLTYSEYEQFTGDLGYAPTPRHDVSLAALVAARQNTALESMFDPLVLGRLVDLPSKSAPGQTMTLADLFTWTQQSIFGDLASGTPGRSVLRHNLQRNYARLLEHLAVDPPAGTPYDAQALALHELGSVEANVRRDLTVKGLDLETQAHLEALQTEVRRTLDAKQVTSNKP
jgi:Met-zincin